MSPSSSIHQILETISSNVTNDRLWQIEPSENYPCLNTYWQASDSRRPQCRQKFASALQQVLQRVKNCEKTNGPELFWELCFSVLFFFNLLSCPLPLQFATFWSWKLSFQRRCATFWSSNFLFSVTYLQHFVLELFICIVFRKFI